MVALPCRVDQGEPGSFFYAEVEFPTREAALAWAPQGPWADYLSREVTGQPGQSMPACCMALPAPLTQTSWA